MCEAYVNQKFEFCVYMARLMFEVNYIEFLSFL